MANHLASAKVAAVLAMTAAGAGTREIERATGIARETVRNTIQRFVDHRARMHAAMTSLWDKLEAMGLSEALDIDELLDLDGLIRWNCVVHPQANVETDFDDVGNCLRCSRDIAALHADGMKRHHARHKAAGTPILPPWRRLPR